MRKQKARLENWRVVGNQLRGDVYGHPLLRDGADVSTSWIVNLDEQAKTCETLNTIYRLGKPYAEPTADTMITMQNIVKLHEHCRKFINDNRISHAEVVHQTDRVIENAYEFIEGICDIVGYAKNDQDEA